MKNHFVDVLPPNHHYLLLFIYYLFIYIYSLRLMIDPPSLALLKPVQKVLGFYHT